MKNFFLGILFLLFSTVFANATADDKNEVCSGFAKWTKDGEFKQIRKSKCMTEDEYQALEQNAKFKPYIDSKTIRSKTVIVAECEGGNTAILKALADKGFIIGKGYGSYKDSHIRIANFPVHSKEQVEMICDIIASF